MTYVQNSVYAEGAAPMGHSVSWYTDTAPVQAITLESPSGPGDVLVRSELFVQVGYYTFETIGFPNVNSIPWTNVVAALEVYSVGAGGFPDPRQADQRAQNRVAFRVPGAVYLDKNGNQYAQATGSTDGYVVSKGIRSPAQYGPGHPEARVGLWTSLIGSSFLALGLGQGTWVYHLSCIWDVP